MKYTFRREMKADFRTVEELIRTAFWNLNVPGCDEHYLAHLLRNHPDFVSELDLVAELNGQIIGQIMYTHSSLLDQAKNKIPTLTFGPVSVLPAYQGKGVGSALINHTKRIATEMGFKAIIILGYPHYYYKFGFKSCRDYAISDQTGKYPYGQLVLELEPGFLTGKDPFTFHYSKVYDNIDENELEKFDKTFSPLKKEFQLSQALFSMAVRAYVE